MTLRIMRRLGAITLLVVGAVHLQQYIGNDYSVLPTIGPLFLLNAIGAGIVAICLLAPIERILGDRQADLVTGLLATAALAIAIGSLVALFIAESQPLFGFMEDGYDTPILIAIVSEALTTILLAPVAVASLRRATSSPRALRSRSALSS
ncbi:MAG TPA: hypothetical protein VN880_10735 [Solirubrobacteraceae bacterium]|nr:hypothetical protein [Solirubrobacteraceae bacterium]